MPLEAVLARNRLLGCRSAVTGAELTVGITKVGAGLVFCDFDLLVTSNGGSTMSFFAHSFTKCCYASLKPKLGSLRYSSPPGSSFSAFGSVTS